MNKNIIKVLSSFALILTTVIWGLSFVVVKDSLDYIGPIWMIAFRFSIAAICLALIFFKKIKTLDKIKIFHGALTGLFLFLAYLFQTIGCKYTTAGKNAFLTTIYVFLVPVFAWPVTKRRPHLYMFVCALISIIGIALLSLGNDGFGNINLGDILTLFCGIFFALHIIFSSKYTETDDPILLSVLQFAFAAIFGWMLAPFFDSTFPMQIFHGRVMFSILFLGIFASMIGFGLQNIGLKYLPSTFATLLLSFESVFGVLFGVFILKEKMTKKMIFGCILIFLAVVFAQIIPEIKARLWKYNIKNEPLK